MYTETERAREIKIGRAWEDLEDKRQIKPEFVSES